MRKHTTFKKDDQVRLDGSYGRSAPTSTGKPTRYREVGKVTDVKQATIHVFFPKSHNRVICDPEMLEPA